MYSAAVGALGVEQQLKVLDIAELFEPIASALD